MYFNPILLTNFYLFFSAWGRFISLLVWKRFYFCQKYNFYIKGVIGCPFCTSWYDSLGQWFSNLSYKHPCPAHFVCLPFQTHPVQVLQSLLMSWWVESGVSDKGDIQNVQGRGACRTGLKTTARVLIKSLWHTLVKMSQWYCKKHFLPCQNQLCFQQAIF